MLWFRVSNIVHTILFVSPILLYELLSMLAPAAPTFHLAPSIFLQLFYYLTVEESLRSLKANPFFNALQGTDRQLDQPNTYYGSDGLYEIDAGLDAVAVNENLPAASRHPVYNLKNVVINYAEDAMVAFNSGTRSTNLGLFRCEVAWSHTMFWKGKEWNCTRLTYFYCSLAVSHCMYLCTCMHLDWIAIVEDVHKLLTGLVSMQLNDCSQQLTASVQVVALLSTSSQTTRCGLTSGYHYARHVYCSFACCLHFVTSL